MIQLLRVEDWIKNFLIFIPLIFTNNLFITEELLITIISFFIFSMASSSVYLFNDIIDFQVDKLSDLKKKNQTVSKRRNKFKWCKKNFIINFIFNFSFFVFNCANYLITCFVIFIFEHTLFTLSEKLFF